MSVAIKRSTLMVVEEMISLDEVVPLRKDNFTNSSSCDIFNFNKDGQSSDEGSSD